MKEYIYKSYGKNALYDYDSVSDGYSTYTTKRSEKPSINDIFHYYTTEQLLEKMDTIVIENYLRTKKLKKLKEIIFN